MAEIQTGTSAKDVGCIWGKGDEEIILMLVCLREAEKQLATILTTHISWLKSSPALKAALDLAANAFARAEF